MVAGTAEELRAELEDIHSRELKALADANALKAYRHRVILAAEQAGLTRRAIAAALNVSPQSITEFMQRRETA